MLCKLFLDREQGRRLLAAGALFLGVVSAVRGDSTYWSGALDTDWSTGGNWDNGVPNIVTDAVVDTNAGNMPTLSGGSAATAYLYVGSTAGSDAALTVTGSAVLNSSADSVIGYQATAQGSILLQGNSTWSLTGTTLTVGLSGTGNLSILDGSSVANVLLAALGDLPGGNGTILVSGAGSSLGISTALFVGGQGAGNLTIASGGVVEANTEPDWYSGIGYAAGSTGCVTVTGAGSQWINHSSIYVGYAGNGTLGIFDGGYVSSTTSQIGVGGIGNATVDGAGSQWVVDGGLYVGDGGNATLDITSGGAVCVASLTIATTCDFDATVTVNGCGSTLSVDNSLDIGANGYGALDVQDGGVVTAASVNVGAGGYGVLNVSGSGSSLTAESDFNVGYFSEGEVTVSDGGSILADSGATIGYGYTGCLTVTGAGSTFTVNNNDLNVGWAANANLTVADGATVTLNGGRLVMSDEGIFTHVTLDGGTLEVGGTDGLKAYNDNTNYQFLLDGGTLKVIGSDLTTNISITLADDSVSYINTNGYNATVTGELGGPGSFVKTGAGVLALSADNCYAGPTTVAEGTLSLPELYSKIFGDVIVEAAGTISGQGDILGALTINGTLSPGNSPGILSASNVTVNAGSTYHFEINDALEGCGCEPTWDTLMVFGDLDLAEALEDCPMIIALNTLNPADNTPGQMANFDPSQGYIWLIAAVYGVINGFDSAKFDVDTTNFLNAFNGAFEVISLDGNLQLVYTPVPEPSTYAALAGLAVLGAALHRRRRSRR